MATRSNIAVRELVSEAEIATAFELMRQLRPHLQSDTFIAMVALQRLEGYRLFAGYGPELLCVDGVRETCTLARGRHLFIDDLVTDTAVRGRGAGTAMLRWLAGLAADKGLPRIYLDSRDSAIGFYRQLGFTFLTSVPCWIDVQAMRG